jgi:hypothetical protein
MAKYVKLKGKLIKEDTIDTSIIKNLSLKGDDFEDYSISSRKIKFDSEIRLNKNQIFDVGELGINIGQNDPSAILHIDSIDKGVLFPRVTASQRNSINNPAIGLMIFNYNSKTIDIYNGNKWASVITTDFNVDFDLNGNELLNALSIYITGNVQTNSSNIFMGQENAYIKNLEDNTKLNIEFPQINFQSYKIGVNNDFPQFEFDVNGTVGLNYLNMKESLSPQVESGNAAVYFGNDGFVHIKLQNKDFPILNMKFIQETPIGEIDGNNNVYFTSYEPIPNSLRVYINGIRYMNYILEGNKITMEEPIWQGAELFVEYVYIDN